MRGGWRRWVYGGSAALEVLLLGGLVQGWPSLVFLLKFLHVNQHLCPRDVTSANVTSAGAATNVNYTEAMLPYDGGQYFWDHSTSAEHLTNLTLSRRGEVDQVYNHTKELTTALSEQSRTVADTVYLTPILNGTNESLTIDTIPLQERPDLSTNTNFTTNASASNSNVTSILKNGGEDDSQRQPAHNESEAVLGDVAKDCEEQDAAFALSFTIVTAVMSSGTVIVGYAHSALGIRITRLIFGLLLAGGMLMIGSTSPELPLLLIPGSACVGLGGLALLITNVQLGAMFGRGGSTFVGVLCGCYDVSAIVQFLIKVVVTSGVSFLHTYIGMTFIACLTFISTLLWSPRGATVDVKQETSKDQSTMSNEEKIRSTDGHYVTSSRALSNMTSPLFFLQVLWFSLLQLRYFFFLEVLNRWLTQLTNGDLSQVDHYTSVQLYMGIASFAFAVLAGTVYDVQRHRYADFPSREWRLLGPGVAPLSLGSVLCCLLSVLVLARDPRVLYLTFLVATAFRSTTYSLAASFISNTFPLELFGVLYGIQLICGGILGTFQYALFLWAQISLDSILHVNIFLLCISAFTFIHPLHILWLCRRSCSPDRPRTPTSEGDQLDCLDNAGEQRKLLGGNQT